MRYRGGWLAAVIAIVSGALAMPAAGQRPRAAAAILDTQPRIRGLPPDVPDSLVRALGPQADTLVQTSVEITPPWAPDASVAPGTLGNPGSDPLPSRGMWLRLAASGLSVAGGADPNVELPFAHCPFVLRLHRRADRTDPPVWRSDRARGALACPVMAHPSPRYVDAEWDLTTVLGDSLPAGHYALAYDVRLGDGRVVTYTAGGGYLTADPTPPVRRDAALRYRASVSVLPGDPESVLTTVWVRNPTARWLLLDYGYDYVRLHLFRTVARMGAPAWRSEARAAVTRGGASVNRLVLHRRANPPRDSLPLTFAVRVREVRSDSTPPGRYHATALVSLDDGSAPSAARYKRVRAGTLDLPAGP